MGAGDFPDSCRHGVHTYDEGLGKKMMEGESFLAEIAIFAMAEMSSITPCGYVIAAGEDNERERRSEKVESPDATIAMVLRFTALEI
eukprot:752994-Hanusia_phi.AAC.3